MLQALAVLAGMRGLGDVLARVQSHVLGSVVMALQRLGLQDFVSADWQALSTEPEGSGSDSDTEDSPGAPAIFSHHCTGTTERPLHGQK